MTEVFIKYGPGRGTRPEDLAESPGVRCVVAHPDAGGQCEREAVGEVWALAFCEAHGREAEFAYMQEINETVSNKLEALGDGEQHKHDRDRALLAALVGTPVPPRVDYEAHDAAMAAAYPPDELAGNTDPDILAFDYEDRGRPTPYDWWCQARLMVVRFMREAAGEAPELVGDLERLRERATVQELLAGRDLDRRWRKPVVG